MTTVKEVNYNVTRGEYWKRLVIPKDKRTRRKRVPTHAAAALHILEGPNAGKYYIPSEVNSEGGVSLAMSETQTLWLEVGEHPWDMVVSVSTAPLFTTTVVTEKLILRGVIRVSDRNNITPMEVDDDEPEALEPVE